MQSTTCSGSPLTGMGSHCHAAPSARLCLCSGLALDCSSGSSKRQETRSLHAPHAATCCGNPAKQGLRLLCLTSKYSSSNVCTRSYFLPFTQLLMLQPETLTSFCLAFSSFMLPPLPLLFLLGREGLLKQQGEEGVQLWFELLCLETIVAG